MNLAGHLTHAVIAQEILFEQQRKFQNPFMFLPAADLFEELGVNVLEGLGLFGELLLEPFNGGCLIGNEKLEVGEPP